MTPWLRRPPVQRLLQRASEHEGWVVARAPGRLDVMGGIADYMGSRVCQLPLAVEAAALVAPRDDGRILCSSDRAQEPVACDAGILQLEAPGEVREKISGWARYPLGCAFWLAQRAALPKGLTIRLESDVPVGGGISSSAAILVATLTALCGLAGVTLDPLELAAACQWVENHVVGAPAGLMDPIASNMGRADRMIDIRCQPASDGKPAQVLGFLPAGGGFAFLGIHSGVRHEVSGHPYTDARVSAFMAVRMLAESGCDVEGFLANVPLVAYERELRSTLPPALDGRTFLQRFGDTGDSATRVDPEKTYRVRDAADHHVREAYRVERFVGALEGGDMRWAGQLMSESHASYGHSARLGHPMTDRLADLAREAGLLGCRVTGGGCGGVVAVLAPEGSASQEAVAAVRARYTAQTGRPTQLFSGSSDGAATTGYHKHA